MTDPIIRVIDSLIADQERTPAQLWLERAAANLKRMEETSREAGEPNKQPVANQ